MLFLMPEAYNLVCIVEAVSYVLNEQHSSLYSACDNNLQAGTSCIILNYCYVCCSERTLSEASWAVMWFSVLKVDR